MTETQPKHMTGALLSGVIYLDGEGAVKEVHWCVTPDGETAPADVQPVIRRGGLDEASELLPAMLAELTERFAQSAAVEAAREAKSKKKQAGATNTAVPQTGARAPNQMKKKSIRSQKVKERLKSFMKKKPNLMNLTRKLGKKLPRKINQKDKHQFRQSLLHRRKER